MAIMHVGLGFVAVSIMTEPTIENEDERKAKPDVKLGNIICTKVFGLLILTKFFA